MALKSNFEATSDIASPFVDEIANPGTGAALANKARKTAAAMNAAFGRKHTVPETAQISSGERDARTTHEQKQAQANVDRAEFDHGAPTKNKNRKRAEGQF